MLQAERERHDDFLKFQREQAELNRKHELRMLEIIMKFSNVQPQGMHQHDATHVQPFQPHAHVVPPQYAQYSSVAYAHKLPPQPNPSQVNSSEESHILIDMDKPNKHVWYHDL